MFFTLKIKISSPEIDLSINSGNSWLIEENQNDNSFSLFDWLEDRKYSNGGKIEFIENGVSVEGLFAVRKYIEILRFRINENESASFYYQQRYHATENQDIIKLKDFLGDSLSLLNGTLKEFELSNLMHETINMLSSGEFRKACIVKAFAGKPKVMFIEDPYSGIDQEGKLKIDKLLEQLASEGTSIVISSNNKHKPQFIRNSLNLNGVQKQISISSAKADFALPKCNDLDYENTFEFKNATVNYGERTILKNINWTVRRGEKWSLAGKNGAGKSTLLSMLYADNPQVYSNDVFLFGKKRGTGESIWDVKDRITYFSSEMFRYFDKTYSVEQAIDYLVHQNPYSSRQLNEQEINFKNNLLEYFEIKNCDRALNSLPAVQQRLILLIAGLVKNTPLLILDEPFNGFDDKLLNQTVLLIEKYSESRTFIMVTHNPEELPGNVNRRFLLEDGIGKQVNFL
jgi:molybdate transport system ATP-binding protein